MVFRKVVEVFEEISKNRSRLKITDLLAELFRASRPSDARIIAHLIKGELEPPYKGFVLGIGEKMVEEAIALASGYPVDKIETEYYSKGDLGLVAEEFLERRKQTPLFSTELTLTHIMSILHKISEAEGEGSHSYKVRLLSELFSSATPPEAKYIARIVLDQLRIGVGEPTILDALSMAVRGDKSLREKIERAYTLCSDIGLVAESALTDVKLLDKFRITPFIPILPALAERAKTAEEIYQRLPLSAVEWKYDGFRLAIHKKGTKVRLFSRRLDDMTNMFPDIIDYVSKLPVSEIIFEGEVLAFDEENNRFYSFQETIRRRRKYDIKKAMEELPLRVYAFDLHYLEGEEWIDKPYKERRKKLEELLPFDKIFLTHKELADSPAKIKKIFDQAVKLRLEGIIAKDLDAPYTAGKRGFSWIKLKKSYFGEIDTIDAVIVGYYRGKGARASIGIGGVLVAVYNPNKARFETLAKVASGYSEEELKTLLSKLSELKQNHPPFDLDYELEPDVWVKPSIVIEVAYDEITKSPVHTCLRKDGRGYALRFPRVVRIRDDKSIFDITTSQEIEEMYKKQ